MSLLYAVPGSNAPHMRWRRAQRTVTNAEGPERIAMEWWRHQEVQPTRDYHRIEDSDGRRFWIFRAGLYRDTAAPAWFLHGMFA